MQNLQNKLYFSWFFRCGLISVALIPMLIGDSLIFPLITTKAFFFYILVDILLVCYLLHIKSTPKYPKYSTLLFFYLGLHLFWLFADLVGGINFFHSFWGNYERMVGLFNNIHLIVFLWILLSEFTDLKDFRKLLWASVCVSFFVCVYGILQKLGVVFPGILAVSDIRMQSTIGNAAFLACFNLIHLFYCVYLFRDTRKLWQKILLVSLFLLNVVVLYYTGTRGAFVALGVSVSVMACFVLWGAKSKKMKLSLSIFLVAGVLATSLLFVYKDSSFVSSSVMFSRLTNISLSDTTTNSRLLLWRMAYNAAKERPLLGYGTNNMRIPLDKNHDYRLTEHWFDSSHNIFFDELLAHGYIGLVLFCLLFVLIFWEIFKLKSKDFFVSTVLLGLFVAYVVQGFFIFDSFIISVFFVLSFGILVVATQKNTRTCSTKTLPPYLVYVICIVLMLVLPIIYVRSITPAKDIITAYRLVEKDLEQVVKIINKVDNQILYGYDIIAPAMAETALVIFAKPEKHDQQDLQDFSDALVTIYKKAITETGDYSKFYVNLAKLYQRMHPVLGGGMMEESFALLEQAHAYSPNRIDAYYAKAQGYYNIGETEMAVEILQESLTFGVQQHKIYLKLADIFVRKGSVTDFLDSIHVVAEIKPGSLSDQKLEEYARILVGREKWVGALEVFLMLSKQRSNDIDTYYNIALVYKKLGEKEKAQEWAQKIIDLNPYKADDMHSFMLNL